MLKELWCKAITPDGHELSTTTQRIQQESKSKAVETMTNEIQNQIKQAPSCQERKILEKYLDKIQDINYLYNTFQKTKFTKDTNKEIVSLLQDIKLENLENKEKEIRTIIQNENNNLKDTYIWQSDTIRDIVEKNIYFKGDGIFDIKHNFYYGTYNENEDINEFLQLFTVEYINLLSSRETNKKEKQQSLWKQRKEKPLNMSENELKSIIWKIQKKNSFPKIKNIGFLLQGGIEKVINFRHIV